MTPSERLARFMELCALTDSIVRHPTGRGGDPERYAAVGGVTRALATADGAMTDDSVPAVVETLRRELEMLFFRPEDILDVERMLVVQSFERAFVREALVEMLEDDPRVEKR